MIARVILYLALCIGAAALAFRSLQGRPLLLGLALGAALMPLVTLSLVTRDDGLRVEMSAMQFRLMLLVGMFVAGLGISALTTRFRWATVIGFVVGGSGGYIIGIALMTAFGLLRLRMFL